MSDGKPISDQEIVDVLRERGLDQKLIEARQIEREKARDEIFPQLRSVEQDDDALGKKLAVRRAKATMELQAAQAAAAAARRALAAIEADGAAIGIQSQNLRGRLRLLSDPRIDDALRQLGGIHEKARGAFGAREITSRELISGVPVKTTVGNHDEVNEVLAQVTLARHALEALKEQPRPVDLPGAIDAIVGPCLNLARRLVGL